MIGDLVAGILHRDIKPENILLVHNSPGDDNLNGVILSDFGFSHQVSPKSRLACGKQVRLPARLHAWPIYSCVRVSWFFK